MKFINKKNVAFYGIILLLMIMVFVNLFSTYVYSADLGLGDLDKYEGKNPGSDKLLAKANIIVASIKAIGIILSVVILMIIGIKYMMGSVEERADYKKTLWPYLVGAFMVFTVSLIPNIIYTWMKNM